MPGYWNEIAQSAAQSQGNTLDQNARLFAELNVALADAVIAHFEKKLRMILPPQRLHVRHRLDPSLSPGRPS